MTELPLFPLMTVLFPDGPLALRVFEPRYLDMVARCLRGTNRFGVVAIRAGAEVGAATTYSVGTTAEIVDWHQETAGVLGIRAVGREGFRLTASERQHDGLYVGRVTELPTVPTVPLPAEHEPLAQLLKRIVVSLELYRDLELRLDDAVWVGARLAELLPFTLAQKQELLELYDAHARLALIAGLLRRLPERA